MEGEAIIEVYSEPKRRALIARVAGVLLVVTLIVNLVMWGALGLSMFGFARGDQWTTVGSNVGMVIAVVWLVATFVAFPLAWLATGLPIWARVVGVVVPGIGLAASGAIVLCALPEMMNQIP
jgi:hypothetical protein